MLCCCPYLVSITWITAIPPRQTGSEPLVLDTCPKPEEKMVPAPMYLWSSALLTLGSEMWCRALKGWFRQTDVATRCSKKRSKSQRTPQRYNLHWTPAPFSTWLGASTGSAESGSRKAAEPPRPLASTTDTTPILYLIFQINKIQNRWSLTHTGNSTGTEPNWRILRHTWSYSQDCGIKFADKLDASLTVDGCTTAQI